MLLSLVRNRGPSVPELRTFTLQFAVKSPMRIKKKVFGQQEAASVNKDLITILIITIFIIIKRCRLSHFCTTAEIQSDSK